MTTTIRIDDEVYAWLQKHGRPFESPNTALRRIAKLEPEVLRIAPVKKLQRERSRPGKELQKLWNIPSLHTLSDTAGTFYQNLKQFPGALCDRHGYIIFKTEKIYRNTDGVQVGAKTNVPKGISTLKGYVKKE